MRNKNRLLSDIDTPLNRFPIAQIKAIRYINLTPLRSPPTAWRVIHGDLGVEEFRSSAPPPDFCAGSPFDLLIRGELSRITDMSEMGNYARILRFYYYYYSPSNYFYLI